MKNTPKRRKTRFGTCVMRYASKRSSTNSWKATVTQSHGPKTVTGDAEESAS